MSIRTIALTTVLLAAGCSSPEDVKEELGVKDKQPVAAATAKAEPRKMSEETATYTFDYAYPVEVAAIPALAARLDGDAEKAKAGLAKDSEEGAADSKANDYPFNPYSYSEEWKVVADLPQFLSLSGQFATYSGGAHGMYGLESLVWDKRREAAMTGIEMFASAAALDAALGQKLCDALDAERRKKRGPEYQPSAPGDDYGFDSCQHIKDATVLVGSSNGQTFDRIGVWFGPYVAGPYAEGEYELNFPVDAAVLGAVKPQYRNAFSVRR